MIREAKIDDAKEIAKIILKTWEHAYTNIIDPNYHKKMREEEYTHIILNNIIQGIGTIFVYEDDNSIKGSIAGKQNNGKYDCEIIGFYVLPDYQRQGIGKALLNEMKNHFKSRGCKRMLIWTLLNAKNNDFYKSQGGIALERKGINIDNKEYPGVGFVFQLC